jgi:hypothetical protein
MYNQIISGYKPDTRFQFLYYRYTLARWRIWAISGAAISIAFKMNLW